MKKPERCDCGKLILNRKADACEECLLDDLREEARLAHARAREEDRKQRAEFEELKRALDRFGMGRKRTAAGGRR